MKQILVAAVMIFNSYATFAADASKPAPPIPALMKQEDCQAMLGWLEVQRPKPEQIQEINQKISDINDKEATKADSSMGRRAFADGARLLEAILLSFASNESASQIATEYRQQIVPAAVHFRQQLDLVKRMQALSADIQAQPTDEKKAQFEALTQQNWNLRLLTGRLYSRYEEVLSIVVSLANGQGVLEVKSAPQSPARIQDGKKVAADGSPLAPEILIRDLTSPQVAETARQVLAYWSQEIGALSLPATALPAGTQPDEVIPYPNLQVVRTLFANDPVARLGNREWSLEQQSFWHNPALALGYLLTDVGSAFVSWAPDKLKPLASFLVAYGNANALAARYHPHILEAIRAVRYADEKGNYVVSTDALQMKLLLTKLFEGTAKGISDDELVTFAGTLMLSSDVWPQMLKQLSAEAGVPIPTSWLPDSLQTDGTPKSQDRRSSWLIQDKKGNKKSKAAAQVAVRPAGADAVTDDGSDAAAPADAPVAPTVADAVGAVKADSPEGQRAAKVLQAALDRGEPTGANVAAGLVASYRLARLLNAVKVADQRGSIPLTGPPMNGLVLNVAINQFVGWLGFGGGAYTLYQSFNWLNENLIHPLGPALLHLRTSLLGS